MPCPIPDCVLNCTISDVVSQPMQVIMSYWGPFLRGHPQLLRELKDHLDTTGGSLQRGFLHDRATGDPYELFLLTQAWGHRKQPRFARMNERMLLDAETPGHVAKIVNVTQRDGALAGWHELHHGSKIKGLGYSFGTKLLHFAGYTTTSRQRPLILDRNVQKALNAVGCPIVPLGRNVWQAHYEAYIDLATAWASDPVWRQEPVVAEYGLFEYGKRL